MGTAVGHKGDILVGEDCTSEALEWRYPQAVWAGGS